MARGDAGKPKPALPFRQNPANPQISQEYVEKNKVFTAEGTYRPLYAHGKKADGVVAFMRGETVMTITSRFILENDWSDMSLELPSGLWHNLLNGDTVTSLINKEAYGKN